MRLRGLHEVTLDSSANVPAVSVTGGEPNGFWLCARSDLAKRTFYVGDVLPGSVRYYRVRSARVTRLPTPRRLSCGGRSRLIGRLAKADGFWLCLGKASGSGSR